MAIVWTAKPNPATTMLSSGRSYTLHGDYADAWQPGSLEALVGIESRLSAHLERSEHTQLSTEAAVESLRHSVADHATDLARAVEPLACMCAVLVERVDAEQFERRSLVEAVAQFAIPSTPSIDARPTARRSRVIGGTVFASAETPRDSELSLAERESNAPEYAAVEPVGSEVWSAST